MWSNIGFSEEIKQVVSRTATENKASIFRAPDKVNIFISMMHISSPNPVFDHLLESSHQDDSNKWSNIGFGEEITQVISIEVNFKHVIWISDMVNTKYCIKWLVHTCT